MSSSLQSDQSIIKGICSSVVLYFGHRAHKKWLSTQLSNFFPRSEYSSSSGTAKLYFLLRHSLPLLLSSLKF